MELITDLIEGMLDGSTLSMNKYGNRKTVIRKVNMDINTWDMEPDGNDPVEKVCYVVTVTKYKKELKND